MVALWLWWGVGPLAVGLAGVLLAARRHVTGVMCAILAPHTFAPSPWPFLPLVMLLMCSSLPCAYLGTTSQVAMRLMPTFTSRCPA